MTFAFLELEMAIARSPNNQNETCKSLTCHFCIWCKDSKYIKHCTPSKLKLLLKRNILSCSSCHIWGQVYYFLCCPGRPLIAKKRTLIWWWHFREPIVTVAHLMGNVLSRIISWRTVCHPRRQQALAILELYKWPKILPCLDIYDIESSSVW